MSVKECSPLSSQIKALASCGQCGACASECPVFLHSRDKADSPSGKINLLQYWLENRIDAAAVARVLRRCTLCGRCETACPSDVPLTEIFREAQNRLARFENPKGISFALNRFLLKRPFLADLFVPLEALLVRVKALRVEQDRSQLPPMASFRMTERAKTAKGGPKVVLFTGCIARRRLPDIARDCVVALSSVGCQAIWAKSQRCCGSSSYSRGDARMAAFLARKNTEVLNALDYDYLLTLCPACLSAICNLWPRFAKDAEKLASRAMDINSFLASRQVTLKPVEQKTYWHEPCLLKKEEAEAARYLAGVEVLADFGRSCCGEHLTTPPCGAEEEKGRAKIGASLEQNLRDAIAASGARQAVSACPHCLLAMKRSFHKNGDQIVAQHSVQAFLKRITS